MPHTDADREFDAQQDEQAWIDDDRWVRAEPTWSKVCEAPNCGRTVERYRGEGDVTCDGGEHSYNAGGQRLRDDYRGNPSMWDDEIGDLEGYEMQHGGDW